jgi:phospholipase A2
MASGGGFRAMIAYCGAYKAMEDIGLIDCATYTSALSGSSWYLATLYTHPDFTQVPHITHKIIPEIRACVEKHWQVHLSPPWSSKYLRKIIAKSVNGQPVSFTDFYGYLVGQQLLKGV